MIACSKVICVGTIWDLDDLVYPELDDYSAMSRWNLYQILKYQPEGSKKEREYNRKKKPNVARNPCGIKVKACCASCQFKDIMRTSRWCSRHLQRVSPEYGCEEWEMHETYIKLNIKHETLWK